MFWGVTILPGRRYSQKVETTYHLSKACLELDDKSQDKPKRVSLMLEHNKTQYLLCNLDSDKNIQTDLDLLFSEDEEITFYLNGEGIVHLTGYLLEMEDDDDIDDMDDEEEENESILENLQNLVSKKRKIAQDEASAKKIKAIGAKSEKITGENGIEQKGDEAAMDEDDDDDDDDEEDDDFDEDDDEEDDEEADEEEEDEEDEEEEVADKPANVSASKQNMGKAPETPKANGQVKNDFKPKNFQQKQQKPKFGGQQGGQQNQQNKFGQQNKGQQQQQQGFGKKFQQNKQGGGFGGGGFGGGQNRPKGQFTPGGGQKGGKFFNKNQNKRSSMN